MSNSDHTSYGDHLTIYVTSIVTSKARITGPHMFDNSIVSLSLLQTVLRSKACLYATS